MSPPILVDTNVIFACHDAGCWETLTGAYQIETVVQCVEEAQTGALNRPRENRIVEAALVRSLSKIHTVEPAEWHSCC